MSSKVLILLSAALCVCLGLAPLQQTLEKIPATDFTRETEVDAAGLKQFKAFEAKCPNCEGQKEATCLGCEGRELPNCSECKGTKRAPCRMCAGKGALPDPLLQVVCMYCRGSSWYDCALCAGQGFFTETSAEGGSVDKPCGGCKKVGRYVCTVCEGGRLLDTQRIRKKPLMEATAAELREAREKLTAFEKELAVFEPLERAAKTSKALEALVAKPSKLVPQLADMLLLLEEVQKGLSRAGANYTNFGERQNFQFLTFRDRSVHLVRHDLRVIELCLERAEFNENVAKTKK